MTGPSEAHDEAPTLLPCPFCGGEAEELWPRTIIGNEAVRCKTCLASVPCKAERAEWNRRFAPSATAPQPATARSDLSPFQGRVAPFMEHCFGPEISADTVERYHRFIEESLELAQALGCSAQDAHMLVDYVFSRPVGQPHQEVGGVMVTLAALCLAADLDMHIAGENELWRVWGKIDVIREKQRNKPKGSPIPQAPQSETPAGGTAKVPESYKEFAQRAAKNIINSADAQCFRWLLKHHSGSGKAMGGVGMRCWIGGVEFQGDDVATAILEAIDREKPTPSPDGNSQPGESK